MKSLFTLLLIATCALSTGARGQNSLQNRTPVHCPTASEIGPIHLYGQWQAEFEGLAPNATVEFEKHPELNDSVRGYVTREGVRSAISGDVDDGEFTLEESLNGQTISATWLGRVADKACGKDIRGAWHSALNPTPIPFILHKAPGWQ